MFHINFLLLGNGVGILMVIIFAVCIYIAKKKETKENVGHFQYKTMSVLSFLLPVSAILYTFIFAATSMNNAGSDAEKAGTAVGSVIGGGIVTFFAFIVGISLGITFYLMGRKKNT